MLQTIEIEIDASGQRHPLEPLNFAPTGRALLTLLDRPSVARDTHLPGRAGDALTLLASPRFANRPAASVEEVKQRVDTLRGEWNERP